MPVKYAVAVYRWPAPPTAASAEAAAWCCCPCSPAGAVWRRKTAFATCVAVILPFCVVSAAVYLLRTPFDFTQALPYLLGGLAGGFVGGKLFPRVPAPWLRYLFAAFLVYGGIRYLL